MTAKADGFRMTPSQKRVVDQIEALRRFDDIVIDVHAVALKYASSRDISFMVMPRPKTGTWNDISDGCYLFGHIGAKGGVSWTYTPGGFGGHNKQKKGTDRRSFSYYLGRMAEEATRRAEWHPRRSPPSWST